MGPTRMSSVLACLLLMVPVACATPATIGGPTTGPVAPGSPATGPGNQSPASPGPGSTGCRPSVEVTEQDGGRTVCVSLGGTLTVTLRTGSGQQWQPIQLTGDALVRLSTTGPSQPAGSTEARFTAARPGSAEVTSARSLCPPPSPGAAACHGLQAFTLAVDVR